MSARDEGLRPNDFYNFINKETHHARLEVRHWITDPHKVRVACVDPKTRKGQVNPPGGVIFLSNEGYLDKFFEVRQGQSGILEAHLNCGYMLVIMGLDTLRGQQRAIDSVMRRVDSLNHAYNANFRIPQPQQAGSAEPYMKK